MHNCLNLALHPCDSSLYLVFWWCSPLCFFTARLFYFQIFCLILFGISIFFACFFPLILFFLSVIESSFTLPIFFSETCVHVFIFFIVFESFIWSSVFGKSWILKPASDISVIPLSLYRSTERPWACQGLRVDSWLVVFVFLLCALNMCRDICVLHFCFCLIYLMWVLLASWVDLDLWSRDPTARSNVMVWQYS